jgi:predicted small lipoprotein YifL
MITRSLMIALVFAGAGLAGCGKTGELEQPAPLFGAKAKADYDAKKRQEAAARAAAASERRDSTVVTPDDAAQQPLTQAPYAPAIPGRTDPFGHAPPGSLPAPGTADDK